MARLLTIYKDLLLCAGAGLCLVLSSPGIDLWPLGFIAFVLLFWCLERGMIKGWKATFLTGLIFYIPTLIWVSVPMTTFGGAPALMGNVIALITALVCAFIFWAPLGLIYNKVQSEGKVILFALVLVALELAKGKYLVGGLPWLNIGQSQQNNLLFLQLVSLVGECGLSFLVVVTGGYIYKAVCGKGKAKLEMTVLGVLIAVQIGAGFILLNTGTVDTANGERIHTARLVQTGIKQEDKWDRYKRAEVMTSLIDRVTEAASASGDFDIIILPESSFNVNPFSTPIIRDLITDISQGHALLLSNDRVMGEDDNRTLYNSMYMMVDGKIAGTYDKMKLAPFGEYFPMETLLKPLKNFFFGNALLFTPGTTPVVFNYDGLRIAPLICFESSFSEIIRERVLMGANVLVTASNESWFGQSLGRHQRYAMDIIHSVEYNRYMLRVTQDGITALITPKGRRLDVFPEKRFYYKDVNFVPVEGLTIFARFGYSWYVLAICAYAIFMLRKRKKATA